MKALAALTITVAVVILSVVTRAGTPSELNYFVSPPSCVPKSDADADRLRLSNGVSIFRDGVENAAWLICPLNFYGNVGVFNNLQLWYLDEHDENIGIYGYVWAKLMRRDRSASGYTEIGGVSSTGGALGYSFMNNFDIPGGPTTGKAFFIEVQMYRQYDTADVGFVGLAIDLD